MSEQFIRMASLRKKDSKIPLRVDSRQKNLSKIPLRIEVKQKKLISTETELNGTSKVVKKEAYINPIDRNKKSTKEIPQKEVKHGNLKSKSKTKENRLPSSGKISQDKVHSNEAPKNIDMDKRVKSTKPLSQVLKDRNFKKVPDKHRTAIDKRKDNQFPLPEIKIPEINISDDPFKSNAYDNHPSQSDIEFVADESMKKLILSNRELTPTILKSCSNIKRSSVMKRPSLYDRPRITVDPYKQALADIATYNLASEGQRFSEMQKNRVHNSPFQKERLSLYNRPKVHVDPYKQALADIANYNLASEGRRLSKLQRSALHHTTPLQKPHFGNPYEEALKSLAELRMNRKTELQTNRKAKSCKKVTFKLSGEDVCSEIECKKEMNEKGSTQVIQSTLTSTSEKCTESSHHLTHEIEENILLTEDHNHSEPNEVSVKKQINDTSFSEKTKEPDEYFITNNTNTKTSSSLKTVADDKKIVHDFSPGLHQCPNNDTNTFIFSQQIRNSIIKTANPFLKSLKSFEVRQSLFSKQPEHYLDKLNQKIFTPQPLSFYPRHQLHENISPEFLSNRTTDILSCAPINTPLVLKRLGKQEQGPVCKKLEFKDSPKETNKEFVCSRESQTFSLQNIMTQQKILDQLANQECSIFMDEATFPCEIRKYLQNPIVQILNYGDETHFVPVLYGD